MSNVTPSSLPAEVQDNPLSVYPGSIPSTPLLWPAVQHPSNQIQQTKGSAKPQATGVQPTTQPNQSTVAPRTTPAHVSNVRVVTRNVGGQKNITVQFNHPSGDPYFSGAKVYLRSGTKEPVLVASGSKSPLTFTASNDSAPHAIHVTSVGNWGETDVLTSPSAPVKLFGPLLASKSSGVVASNPGGATPPGTGDGLTHGTTPWESDSGYITIRDDFQPLLNSTIFSSTPQKTGIGQLGWVLIGTPGGDGGVYGGVPPYLGLYAWDNNSTVSNFGMILLNSSGGETSNPHIQSCWALAENPGSVITWVFKLDSGSGATTAFAASQKAVYVGLTGPTAQLMSSASYSRPDVFIGVRFDTSTTAPSINDSFFTLEVVANSTFSSPIRNNTQGVTKVTNVAPVAGIWHRLDIYFSGSGTVTVTLDGSVTNTLTTAIPKITFTTGANGLTGALTNGITSISWTASASVPESPWSDGSSITFSGFTGAQAPFNSTFTANYTKAAQVLFNQSGGNIASGNATGTATGYPAFTPMAMMGNDDTATPTGFNMMMFVDYFSYIWNPNLGPSAPGSPVATKPRYF
jgi:hypothetical protein